MIKYYFPDLEFRCFYGFLRPYKAKQLNKKPGRISFKSRVMMPDPSKMSLA
jgi:hypothetical protein